MNTLLIVGVVPLPVTAPWRMMMCPVRASGLLVRKMITSEAPWPSAPPMPPTPPTVKVPLPVTTPVGNTWR